MRCLKQSFPEIFAGIIAFIYFIFICPLRLIARDEGFYNLAARLVAEGQTPYLDFFYPQMPLLPYIYAAWFKITEVSWISSRYFSGILASILAVLLVNFCKKKFGTKYAYLTLILYLASNFVLAWYLVSQTYILSTLFLFISFLCAENKSFKYGIYLAGIFLSLAIQCRLFFSGLLPVFLIYLFFSKQNIYKFSAALLLSFVPTMLLAFKSPELFYFNNFAYHFNRSQRTDLQHLNNKLRVAKVIFGLVDSVKFTAWQIPLLIYLSLAGFLVQLIKEKSISLAALILFSLFALNLLPNPAYVQYFCTLIPFTIILACYFFKSIRQKSLQLILIAVCLFIYLKGFKADYFAYTKTGQGVIGIMQEENARHWNMESVGEINEKLQKLCQNPESAIGYQQTADSRQQTVDSDSENRSPTVLSFWPGYILEANCKPYPGSENHFTFLAARSLAQDKKNKYHLLSENDALNIIKNKKADLIVLSPRESKYKQILKQSGYQKQGDKSIYTK